MMHKKTNVKSHTRRKKGKGNSVVRNHSRSVADTNKRFKTPEKTPKFQKYSISKEQIMGKEGEVPETRFGESLTLQERKTGVPAALQQRTPDIVREKDAHFRQTSRDNLYQFRGDTEAGNESRDQKKFRKQAGSVMISNHARVKKSKGKAEKRC